MTIEAARPALLFRALCEVLETEGIEYVILSGYRGFPDLIESDVDFMVSEANFQRLPQVFCRPNLIKGAELVQVMNHESSGAYYVFASAVEAKVYYLHPDACSKYRRKGRLWLQPDMVLRHRVRHPGGWWIPQAAHELRYYLVKRVDKGVLNQAHFAALRECFERDPAEGSCVLEELFGAELAAGLAKALENGDLAWVVTRMQSLRRRLRSSSSLEQGLSRLLSYSAEIRRWWLRVRHPTGMVIAVLGPDGSGKTTVIESLERELLPAFRSVQRFHLRPRLGKRRQSTASVQNPHALLPRSASVSALKLLLFAADYWLAWPILWFRKARSTLIVFDRYAPDLAVDPIRYRIPENLWCLRLVQWLAPQPDLVLVLTANPETLILRKNEISATAARSLIKGYRQLTMSGKEQYVLIDTDKCLKATLAEVNSVVLSFLHNRVVRRLTLH